MSLLTLDPNFKPAFDGVKIASELLVKVAAELPILKAYLFGSSAIGKNTKDSDLDLLIVVPDFADIKTYYNFVNTPFFSPVAVDWIIKTESDFTANQSLGGVSMVASQTGIEIKFNGSI